MQVLVWWNIMEPFPSPRFNPSELTVTETLRFPSLLTFLPPVTSRFINSFFGSLIWNMNNPRFELWSNDSGMRRMNNDSVLGQGSSGQGMLYLLIMTIMFSGANAERVIESNKSVGMKATAWILALISTLVSIFAMVFVIVHRQNKIVRVGQPL